MDLELKHTIISVTTHIIVAFIVSFISVSINNNLYAGLIGLAALLVTGYGLEKITGKRGFKWWVSNGVFIYALVWLVGWIFFFTSL